MFGANRKNKKLAQEREEFIARIDPHLNALFDKEDRKAEVRAALAHAFHEGVRWVVNSAKASPVQPSNERLNDAAEDCAARLFKELEAHRKALARGGGE